eukprot:723767-Amphidinium_carterae.1
MEELKKPKIEEDPNAIPMQFGKATFGGQLKCSALLGPRLDSHAVVPSGYRGSAREGQAMCKYLRD